MIARWEGGPTGRGLAVLRERGLYSDGAARIRHLGDERFDARIEVADPYHAYQHLHAAARALFGDTLAAAAWVEHRKTDLMTDGVAHTIGIRGPSLTAKPKPRWDLPGHR